MAEQQLIDYIKKARDAKQSDEQTRSLLYKSGWTEAEVSEAITLLDQPQKPQLSQPEIVAQPEAEVRPQVMSQPETAIQPKIVAQPEAAIQPEVMAQPQVVSQPQVQPQPQVQAQVQYSQANQQNNMPKIRAKSHTGLKLLIVLIIIIVLAAAGYFVAGQYINLPWNPFRPSPEIVISKMVVSMAGVKSSRVVTQGEVDATTSDKTPIGTLSFNINGESDMTSIAKPKANYTIGLSLMMQGVKAASVNMAIATTGGASYIKINDITIPGAFSYPGLDISKIKGNWVKIDQASIDALKALSAAQNGQTGISNISQADGVALVQKVQALFAAENLFSVEKQLSDEVVGGQDTYHYSVVITKDKIKDLSNKIIALEAQEVSKLQSQNGTPGSSNLLAQNMVQAFVSTFADVIGDVNLEMWIGKKDYMLYQTKVDQVVDLSKAYPTANMQLEFKFGIMSSNFNQPITVAVPANSQKVEDIIVPLLKSQKINNDISQIGMVAQLLASTNKSYYSLCSRGLLNGYLTTYGKNLVDWNNDLIAQGATKPACFSGVQSYCVSTQLADGSYLCIDGTGTLGKTKCTSPKTVCSPVSAK